LENILNISCLENKGLDKRAVVGDVMPAGQKVNHESVSEARSLNSAQTTITHHVSPKPRFDYSKKENL
jgi:hypothetical protein